VKGLHIMKTCGIWYRDLHMSRRTNQKHKLTSVSLLDTYKV